jgi:hypothetical protein
LLSAAETVEAGATLCLNVGFGLAGVAAALVVHQAALLLQLPKAPLGYAWRCCCSQRLFVGADYPSNLGGDQHM